MDRIPEALADWVDRVHQGDARELMARMPGGCVDAIITDPPYGRKWLCLYEAVLDEAPRLLRPGGHLLMILPHYLLPELFAMGREGLRYRWTLAMRQTNGAYARLCNGCKTIAVTWKPIGWWVRLPAAKDDFALVFDGFDNPQPDKSRHKWAQSLEWARYCLDVAWPVGVVLDPFLGSGTVAVACKARGVHYIGMEIAAEHCETARKWLSETEWGAYNGKHRNP